jgi:L-ribulose-5-phosphate 3-epimerase
MRNLIGFMQGRLCAQVDGKIQAFPKSDWESEFPSAAALGLQAMEWTLDQKHLYKNPLLTTAGQARIRLLCKQYQLLIPSLTGDCFMQAPFWKTDGETKLTLQVDFLAICQASAATGIHMVVVPLVDAGRLDTSAQEDELVAFLLSHTAQFAELGVQIIFESDYEPTELRRFIDRLPVSRFGINYDIGNSAALGFDPVEEFAAYGSRVMNVHVKDRLLGGTTVPLTTGAAQFDRVFAELAKLNYAGNFILQTARAADGDHAGAVGRYQAMTRNWIKTSGLALTAA